MKILSIVLSICIMASMTSCLPNISLTSDEGVVINGVKWATRNVDEFGTFTKKPEDAGKFYQWNRKKAWKAKGKTVKNWDSTRPEGAVWEERNDPSPTGWRIPNLDEIRSLFDTEKVNDEWVIQNGVNGVKFTDIATSKSIFLPAVGFREDVDNRNGTLNYAGSYGFYWSSTRNIIYDAHILAFGFEEGIKSASTVCYFGYACPLRCVAQ